MDKKSSINSRNDLYLKINEQEEKIVKYEARLRDVVSAYKNLLTEKTALETTLKAVSATPLSSDNSADLAADNEEKSDVSLQNEEDGAAAVAAESRIVRELKERIRTLTSSISTITEQKNRLELSFQMDKKRLLSEHNERVSAMRQELESADIVNRELQQHVVDLRNRLKQQRVEFERVESDHAIQLQELQGLLAIERSQHEQVELQLEEIKERMMALESTKPSITAAHEVEVEELRAQLAACRVELVECANACSLRVEEMSREYSSELCAHQKVGEVAREKVARLEQLLATSALQHEERVLGLESRLENLSSELGAAERARIADQVQLTKLRERVTHLSACSPPAAEVAGATGSPTQAAVVAIVGPVPRDDLIPASTNGAARHELCCEELEALREEFERYKLRAASVLKSRQTPVVGGTGGSVDANSGSVATLQTQLINLKERYHDTVEEAARREEVLRVRLEQMETEMRDRLKLQEEHANRRISEVEIELTRHRNRTIALLAEKDAELAALRALSSLSAPAAVLAQSELAQSLRGPENVAQLHLQDELARRMAELQENREIRRQFEVALRRSEADMQAMKESMAQLRMDLERVQRPSGQSLEYAKNVVYRYLVTPQAECRQLMLNAIASVLCFSEEERRRASQMHTSSGAASSWWS